MNNRRKQPVQASVVAKFTAALFLIFTGVMSVIISYYAGHTVKFYISTLLVCVSTASYLLISILLSWLITRKNLDSRSEAPCIAWSHLISGGIAFLVLSPLSIILMSSFEVSPLIYITYCSALALLSLALVVIGFYKLANNLRQGSTMIPQILFDDHTVER
jgi:hypothetical protein